MGGGGVWGERGREAGGLGGWQESDCGGYRVGVAINMSLKKPRDYILIDSVPAYNGEITGVCMCVCGGCGGAGNEEGVGRGL